MKDLLHFTADWCKPCEKIKPLVEEYISLHPEIHWKLIDVDTDFDWAEKFDVMSIPTLIVIVDGKITKRHKGVATKEQIEELLS